jgi:hypothetical protein
MRTHLGRKVEKGLQYCILGDKKVDNMKEIRSWSGLVIKKTRKVRGEGRREATKFGEKLIELSKEAD